MWLDATNGELNEVIGSVVRQATKSSQAIEMDDEWGSGTWTFYTIATDKGVCTLVWRGESNGYYSEGVDFWRTEDKTKWI